MPGWVAWQEEEEGLAAHPTQRHITLRWSVQSAPAALERSETATQPRRAFRTAGAHRQEQI